MIKDYLRRSGLIARNIGISATRTAHDVVDNVIQIVSASLGPTFSWVGTLIQRILHQLVDYIWTKTPDISQFKGTVCSSAALIISGLAVCLPATTISKYGRLFLVAMAALVAFTRSYVTASCALVVTHLMASMTPKVGLSVDIHNHISKPQSFQDEVWEVIKGLTGVSVLLTCGSMGLEFPTDGKSLERLMRRHTLTEKTMGAWKFGYEYVTGVIESITRLIYKYAFDTEYTTFDHIVEVENLIEDIIDLTRLEINVDIGRDIKLASKIEGMYATYMNLLRVYHKNRDVVSKLQKFGAPLTEYYRRVADKNPKAHVMRKEPVCLALYGPTGIGKSYLMSRMQQDLLKICGKFDPLNPCDGLVYARAIEQEFWDGYTGQPIAIYDDFAQKVDSPTNPNNEFFEIIRAVNIFPYQLHSAAIQEKANNPFNSEFVVLTTNLANFKPKSIISEEAFSRRIHLNCKINIIEEVRKYGVEEPQLDTELLAKYQYDNDLGSHDLSHIRFESVNGEVYDYSTFIVRVSQQYAKHVRAFNQRQTNNKLTAFEPLPAGAYSNDDQWSRNHETPEPRQPRFYDACEDEPEAPPTRYSSALDLTSMTETELNEHIQMKWYDKYAHYSRDIKNRINELWTATIDLSRIFKRKYEKIIKVVSVVTSIFACLGGVYWAYSAYFKPDQYNHDEALNALATTPLHKDDTIFYKTRTGVNMGLSYVTVLAFLQHSLNHLVYNSNCDECERIKSVGSQLNPPRLTMLPFERYNYFSNLRKNEVVECESVTKVQQATTRVKMESDEPVVESPMRVAPRRPQVKLEAQFESGRAEDNRKKHRVSLEGIRSHQLENLKALVQRNVWVISSYDEEFKNDVGFVTVIAGHKAIINFHYFQILKRHFKDVKPECKKVLFSQPTMTRGHEADFAAIVASAQPIYRGDNQTEFYMITMPKTCPLGRDLTKHLVDPSQASKLARGLNLQLMTYRRDSSGNWKPMTVAGPLEKIEAAEVFDDLDESKSHVYLESVYYAAPTQPGDCGNPIFIDSDEFTNKLLGFHFAGLPGKGIASVITAADIIHMVGKEHTLSDPKNIILDHIEMPESETSFRHRV